MRHDAIALILALSGALHAGTWNRLPAFPAGHARIVTGDGPVVVAGSRAGGLAWWSSAQTAGLRATSWSTIPSAPPAGSSDMLRVPYAIVRGTLLVSRTVDGLEYRNIGEATTRRAVVEPNLHPDVVDHDGRRILASFRDSTSIYGDDLYLSVDSLASQEKNLDGSILRTNVAWRHLALPKEASFVSDCWIEGRILVFSTDSLNWISRDTGATWSKLAGLPDFSRLDMRGDTIVAGSPLSEKLYVSKDAGATWDSSALGVPEYVGFRGGMLFGVFRRAGQAWELARTETLGRTWNTLVVDVPITNGSDVVGWDGVALWTIRGMDLVRSVDNGRTWTIADTGLPEGRVAKVRAFSGTLLALQEHRDQDDVQTPLGRLWSLSDGVWNLVRDSVVDFETMETDTGWAVFALRDTSKWWSGSVILAKLRLERSFNLRTWEKFPGVVPYSVALGVAPEGLLVGEADGVAIVTPGSIVRRDSAWGPGGNVRLDGYGSLSLQDGSAVWSQSGLCVRRNGAVVTVQEYAGAYVSLGSKYGFAPGRNRPGSWYADLAPMNVPYALEKGNKTSGARLVRDSVAVWHGGGSFALMRPEGRRMVDGPSGEGVALVDWLPASALGAGSQSRDSVFVVADLHGQLWTQADIGLGVEVSAVRNSSRLVAGSRGLVLDLERDAHVRIELFDTRGRRQGVLVDGPLAQGRHDFAATRPCGMVLAVATLDGIRQNAVMVAPTKR